MFKYPPLQILLVVLMLTFSASAQVVGFDFMNQTYEIIIQNDDDLTNAAFFSDTENKLLFIDFESINENIIELTIQKGEELVLKDNVSALPKNSIYEINLSSFAENTDYTISLKTSIGVFIKKFKIKVS